MKSVKISLSTPLSNSQFSRSASSECVSPPRDNPSPEAAGDGEPVPVLSVPEVKVRQTTPVAPPPTPSSLAATYG